MTKKIEPLSEPGLPVRVDNKAIGSNEHPKEARRHEL